MKLTVVYPDQLKADIAELLSPLKTRGIAMYENVAELLEAGDVSIYHLLDNLSYWEPSSAPAPGEISFNDFYGEDGKIKSYKDMIAIVEESKAAIEQYANRRESIVRLTGEVADIWVDTHGFKKRVFNRDTVQLKGPNGEHPTDAAQPLKHAPRSDAPALTL